MPHIAITLGDPAGIGPEIVLKYLASCFSADLRANITVIGDFCQASSIFQALRHNSTDSLVDPSTIGFIDLDTKLPIEIGVGNHNSGECSFRSLSRAIDGALAGEFDAIVTAPIAKSAWQLAGHNFPGQTEVLADRSGVDHFGMLFVAQSPITGWVWRTLLATVHLPLGVAVGRLDRELIRQKLNLLNLTLAQDFGIAQPQITIVGINPHSGEGGYLGREEQDWLIPLIDELLAQNIQIRGPVPPDTVWLGAKKCWFEQSQNAPDAYLAMYHDQGLIPIKLLAFEQCVNCTIGLPFVRTSPDHGTAFDIAGQGIADYKSFGAAVEWAIKMTSQRNKNAIDLGISKKEWAVPGSN